MRTQQRVKVFYRCYGLSRLDFFICLMEIVSPVYIDTSLLLLEFHHHASQVGRWRVFRKKTMY